jgi:hypothetical protein
MTKGRESFQVHPVDAQGSIALPFAVPKCSRVPALSEVEGDLQFCRPILEMFFYRG